MAMTFNDITLILNKLDQTLPSSIPLSPAQVTEQNHASTYLETLLSGVTVDSLDQATSNKLATQLARFFRVRTILQPKSAGTRVDLVHEYLKAQKLLPTEALTNAEKTEEQTAVAMLQEILAKRVVALDADSVISGTDVALPEEPTVSTLGNYYTAIMDPTKSLATLYEHTEKNPIKEYIKGQPLVHAAVECDALDFLKKLVAKTNDEVNKAVVDHHNSGRDTPLRFAAIHGKHAAAAILIAAGADVHENKTHTGRTAWSSACDRGDATMLALLIPHMTDLTFSRFPIKKSVQAWAAQYEKPEVMVALAKINKLDLTEVYDKNKNILHMIAIYGCVGVLENFTAIPVEYLEQKTSLGNTPLLLALCKNHRAVAEALFALGADAKAVSQSAGNALHWAAVYGYDTMFQKLLEKGANVSAMNEEGVTVIWVAMGSHLSAEHDSPARQAVVKMLLAADGIENTLNMPVEDKTPLEWAIFRKSPELTLLLVSDTRVVLPSNIEKTVRELGWAKVMSALQEKRGLFKDVLVPKVVDVVDKDKRIAELEKQLAEKDVEIARLKSALSQQSTTSFSNAPVLSLYNSTLTSDLNSKSDLNSNSLNDKKKFNG